MIKIAYCGTHSTGKTTRAKAVSKERGYIMVTEAARSCPFPINRKASRKAQLYIFTKQIQNELEAEAWAERTNAPGIVCDRSILDSIVYSLDRGYTGLANMLTPFAQAWMKTYTKIYWCRPKPDTVPERDGVRDLDPLWQHRIDRLFESVINIFRIKYEEITDVEPLHIEEKVT